MMKLDNQIAQDRKELEHHPPGDTVWAMTLHNLADCLENRFVQTDNISDLEVAIVLNQSALDLHPLDHSNWSDSLSSLTVCFCHRYDKQGTIADLDETITLCRAVLELHSPATLVMPWFSTTSQMPWCASSWNLGQMVISMRLFRCIDQCWISIQQVILIG